MFIFTQCTSEGEAVKLIVIMCVNRIASVRRYVIKVKCHLFCSCACAHSCGYCVCWLRLTPSGGRRGGGGLRVRLVQRLNNNKYKTINNYTAVSFVGEVYLYIESREIDRLVLLFLCTIKHWRLLAVVAWGKQIRIVD